MLFAKVLTTTFSVKFIEYLRSGDVLFATFKIYLIPFADWFKICIFCEYSFSSFCIFKGIPNQVFSYIMSEQSIYFCIIL